MAKKLLALTVASLCACVPCFGQTKETLRVDGIKATAASDSKVVQKGGVIAVESNKDYTIRKIHELEASIANLEKQQSQTTAKLTQIQQTLTTMQTSMEKPKTDKQPVEVKQPAETSKSQTEKGDIVVRRLDTGTIQPQANMPGNGTTATSN